MFDLRLCRLKSNNKIFAVQIFFSKYVLQIERKQIGIYNTNSHKWYEIVKKTVKKFKCIKCRNKFTVDETNIYIHRNKKPIQYICEKCLND